MKLNIECIRDVLLVVENASSQTKITMTYLCENLPTYEYDDINYTCLKLHEGGYIDAISTKSLNDRRSQIAWINDLTFLGHEFLAEIKNDKMWNEIKSKAKQTGTYSLKSLAQIASGVATHFITTALENL